MEDAPEAGEGRAIRLKRAYEAPSARDGLRVLVERLWPRGLSKERAAIDRWAKELAPSTELRRWYAHDPERWEEFRRRYVAELEAATEAVERLEALVAGRDATFVFASRETEKNSAVVLRSHLERRSREAPP